MIWTTAAARGAVFDDFAVAVRGSYRRNRGLGAALSQAAPWPAARIGIAGASGRGDFHGLSGLVGGGARGGWLRGFCPGLKLSMTIMGPPHEGQG